jgi:conjugal transfer pilin signal peptidase TrbI
LKLCPRLQVQQLRNRILKAVLLMAVCVPLGMAIPHYLTVSISSSLGKHVFFLQQCADPSRIHQGDIVRYPHSDAMTDNKSVYMLKRVECAAGQKLSVNGEKEYYCDGRYLGRAKNQSKSGVKVQNFVYEGNIPQGKFFALAPHIDSYDSRYYGLVDIGSIVAKAYPIL